MLSGKNGTADEMNRGTVLRGSARGAISLALLLFSFRGAVGQSIDNAALREHVARGNQLMQHRQFSQALEEYEIAKALDPKNTIVLHNISECHNNWGIACFRQKNYDEAIVHFTKTLALDPRHGQARYNLEICRRSMPKDESPSLDKAEGDFGKIVKKNEKHNKPEEPAGKIVTSISASAPAAGSSAEQGKGKTLFGSFSGGAATYSKSPASTVSSPPAAAASEKPLEVEALSSDQVIMLKPQAAATVSSVSEAKSEFSLEDGLSALELKVYGKKQSDLTVIKRLEKLEMETTGQAGSGTISERIQQLRKNIGM